MTQPTKKLQTTSVLAGFLLWASLAWTQAPESSHAPQEKPQAEQSVSIPHEISPQEEKELFNSVDDLLHFASKDTGLPLKHEVKRRLTSRDEVTAFIEKSFEEDKDAQRLRRSE